MGAFKDSARPNGEVQLAGIAAIETILAGRDSFFGFALRASDTVLPETPFKVFTGGWFVGEEAKKLKSAYGAFAHSRLPN